MDKIDLINEKLDVILNILLTDKEDKDLNPGNEFTNLTKALGLYLEHGYTAPLKYTTSDRGVNLSFSNVERNIWEMLCWSQKVSMYFSQNFKRNLVVFKICPAHEEEQDAFSRGAITYFPDLIRYEVDYENSSGVDSLKVILLGSDKEISIDIVDIISNFWITEGNKVSVSDEFKTKIENLMEDL